MCPAGVIVYSPRLFFGEPKRFIFVAGVQLRIPLAAVTSIVQTEILISAQAGAIKLSALGTIFLTV